MKVERDSEAAFREFGDLAHNFSREVYPSPRDVGTLSANAEANVKLARTLFGKWSLEIVVLIYSMRRVRFEEMRRNLKPITRRVLSGKLKALEGLGIVRRRVISSRPPKVVYSLTERGLMAARLGEPLFLFLRMGGYAPDGGSEQGSPT